MTDLEWFTRAGFGLFVHWDHASQQGIEMSWPMVQVSSTPGDVASEHSISPEQYHSTAGTFNPQRVDFKYLAKLARMCGARYVVFTARHHAGYSMFHTAHSEYSIQNSPYERDLTREFVDAVREEGLRVGIYYSLSDWHHPDYPPFEGNESVPYELWRMPKTDLSDSWPRYIDYLKGQLSELLTNYGKVDLLWFDGHWERTPEDWHAEELRELIRELQPDCIVNDRLPGQGDYATPEQGLPVHTPEGPWELCQTIGDSWAFAPDETRSKSPYTLARYLTLVVERGGNYLLNVGPRADGSLQETEIARLKALGAWLSGRAEALLGAEPGPIELDFDGPVTQRENTIFLHLLMRPIESVFVGGVPVRRIRSVRLLGPESELAYEVNHDRHGALDGTNESRGELIIEAPEPTGALIDIIAVELEPAAS